MSDFTHSATTPPPITLARARTRQPQSSVPSPCIGVCKMDSASGLCKGCFRTIDELSAWSRASDASKLAVWAHIEQRQGVVTA